MQVSFEISLYPLAIDKFKSEIWDFIYRLRENKALSVVTNGMSTQVFGDYDIATQAVMTEVKKVHETLGTAVFVIKIVAGDKSVPENDVRND